MDKIKPLLGIIALLFNFSLAEAIPIPPGATLITENSFFGHITSIYLDPTLAGPGDVDVNSEISGEYTVYKDIPMYGDIPSMLTQFTFHGFSKDYVFNLEFGPDSGWGYVLLNPNNTLSATHNNNFLSDGLEDTFNYGIGNDYGGLNFYLDDYTATSTTGGGKIWWTGVEILFTVGTPIPAPVPGPPIVWLFCLGLICVLLSHRIGENRKF